MRPNLLIPSCVKAFTTAVLLACGLTASATTYYVSPSGDDSNNGTSQATAWRTIDRVNQLAFSYQPGDKVLFKCGGIYRGEVLIGSNGTAAQPITIGAFGNGDRPIIKGSKLVSGWSVYQGNIHVADVPEKVDQVYVAGQLMTQARYPNTGWLRNSQGGGTQMQSADLTQPNGYWNGAVAVVRSSSSSFDTLVVSNYANGTLNFTMPTLNMGSDPWGFYMRGKLSELDSPGEWYYDRAAHKLYFWAPNNGDPNNLTVEASVYKNGVNCSWQHSYMRVENLEFRHQCRAGVLSDGANHVTADNCKFRDLYYGVLDGGTYGTYNGNEFRNTYATAACVFGDNATISNNTFNGIALVDGAGESFWGYFGIRTTGTGVTISNNRLDTIGYIGIIAEANALVEKNVISHALATMNDGGGIAIDHADGLIIQDNVVRDPIGSFANGCPLIAPHNEHMGIGIYFGNTSIKNTIARRNTVYNCPRTGIHVDHTMVTTGLQIKDNVLFNNGIQLTISDYSNSTGAGATPPYYVPNYNDVYSGNVMYSLQKDQLCMLQYNCHGAVPVDFGTFSNNRYFNPYNEESIKVINFVSGAPRIYALERWQTERNEDAGSTRSTERLVPFTTTGELSGNLVQNGAFNSNVTGWTGWPTNAQVTRVTDHLDNGALKAYLPDNSMYPNFTLHNPDLFPIVDQAWYRVRCSLQSNAQGDVVIGIKGQSTFSDPYTTWEQDLPFDTERRDLEMYFQSDLTDQAQIQFINQWTEPMYYLDNVEVTRVSVQPVDPAVRNKLIVNDQSTAQDFNLPDGCWSDVDAIVLNGEISIPAYSSVAIYRLPDDACAVTTGIENVSGQGRVGGMYPNPVLRGAPLNFAPVTNGRFTLTDLRGALVMDSAIPSGKSNAVLPADITPGLYVARITGDDRSETQKLIVR